MKKFLSILLAVMMVLSTVSFAAPSLAGSADTAVEVPAVEVPAEEPAAELAAVAGDESTYGKLIINVDFENFEVGSTMTDYQYLDTILEADDYDPAFKATYWVNWEVGANTIAQETDGNKYIRGGQGYAQVRMENQKYGHGAPDGVYTFVVDAIDFGSAARKISTATQDNYVQSTLVNSGIAAKRYNEWSEKLGEWETLAAEWDGASNNMSWYFTDNATTEVGFDNVKVYYRPRNVKLTIAGEEYEVSTSEPVTVASLAANVKAPTGYVLSGLSLTEGGEAISDRYFFEDTTLYPTFAKDPNLHPAYGKALYVVDFETAAAQNWWGHSFEDNSACTSGGHVDYLATYCDPMFINKNYRIRFLINETANIDQKTVSDASGNHFTQGKSVSKWPQVSLMNYASIIGEPGIYTFSVDAMTDTAVQDFAYHWPNVIDSFSKEVGVWDTVVVQTTLNEAGKMPDASPVINFSMFDAGATISFDNAKLYYKPFTADVTLLYKGEEYVVEDVSTAGVSAASILEAAGIEIPYGKKAVLSETFGGESVGNVINLAMDSAYYVSFVDDDSISAYGKRLFLVDFEEMATGALTDNLTIANYTSNYEADWANIKFNWEVGANVVVEEDGEKFIKGGQGYAQINILDDKNTTRPAGTYTMVYDTKNFGTAARLISMANNLATPREEATIDDEFVDNFNWDTVAGHLGYMPPEFKSWYTDGATTEVGFDNVAVYYRPASVNLTVVDVDGEETVYENCNSSVNVDDLLADVVAPFGYKAALSAEKNGEPLTGTINLVSDAKLYVVLTADETVSFDYGKALFIIDFENAKAQQWWGCSQEPDNSVDGNGAQVWQVASFYDPRFQGNNYRVRFVINETPRFDQQVVVDENGNHYTTGTNGTRWPQVVSTNWGNIQGEAGVYTFMFDAKIEETTETSLTMSNGTLPSVVSVDSFCAQVGVWDTVIVQTTLDAAGNLPKGTFSNFGFDANETTKLSFDNAKLYFKPFNATVELVANGAVVATKENVSTSGVLVSELVDGVKVKGYTVTGVKLGTEVYGLDDTVAVPCDCQLELALEAQAESEAKPETYDEVSIRCDDPMGIRFKASFAASEDDSITDYGWIVTRKSLLVDKELTFDCGVKFVEGYGRKAGVDSKKFFEETDEAKIFTAVLYFSENEADGLPAARKLGEELVARPFVKVDGEIHYGDAVTKSIFQYILDAYKENGELWNSFSYEVQEYYLSILDKVDTDTNDIPDFMQ